MRPGATASGDWLRRIRDLTSTPPGIREAAARGVMDVLRYNGQVGYPPSVATASQSGLPVTGYQYAELLFGQRERNSRILVRISGACARAHKAEKQDDVDQRANAGYFSCCAHPTHIVVPPRFVVEEPPLKRRGESRRGWHMGHGRRDTMRPAFLRSSGDTSSPIGTGRRDP